MKRRALLATLGAAPLTGLMAAQAAAPTPRPDSAEPPGTTIFAPFASAPYPDPSRSHGYDYEGVHYGAAAHYSDSTVALYVPPGFRAGAATDFVVHFHGWRNDVAHVLTRYRLREQLLASGLNAVLVVPQGPKDAPDSGFGKLELDDDGFSHFMHDVARFLVGRGILRTPAIGRIALTAHSGGYGGAGGVLTRGGMNALVSDVLLFDAAYGYYDAFAGWAASAQQNHLLSLFTRDTSTGNAALMGMLQAPHPNIFVFLAHRMTLAALQTRAPTFALTTQVAHDELLQQRDWYALFLRTTALSRTPAS
ncbi:MAG: hypothetical protein ACYDEU_10180 [Vulcanimicrobiaceae bacterium]